MANCSSTTVPARRGYVILSTLHHTDALAGLQAMPEGCVDCCVTSPPYWGLRDYGEGTAIVWDEAPDCSPR